MPGTLIDSGRIVAYYNQGDDWHQEVRIFFEQFRGQFITTCPCLTEAMYILRSNHRVQNELLLDLSRKLYQVEPLVLTDYSRIAELNTKYVNVPGDFADLSLVVVSERLNLTEIVSLDSDFDIYRRYGKTAFKRAFP